MDIGALSSEIKRSRGVEVKNSWNYISTQPYVFITWRLIKHRENLVTNIPADGNSPDWRPKGGQNFIFTCSACDYVHSTHIVNEL